MSTKVRTVIVNATEQPLTMKVGNRNCFFPLGSLKKGGEELCVDWTYQEFVLEDKGDAAGRRLFVSSDDCCDYERITITEAANGKLGVTREPRRQLQSCGQADMVKNRSTLTRRTWNVLRLSSMSVVETFTGSESYEKEDSRAAIERRGKNKRKGAGGKPAPKRGDIKKGIAKDVMRAFTRWTCTWKHSRVAPKREDHMAEEVGLGA